MKKYLLRAVSGMFSVLLLSQVALGQPGNRHVGSTQHTVHGQQVAMHHYAAQGNHQNHLQLQGTHRIASVQGRGQVHVDLHAQNGQFTLYANGNANAIRNGRVSTVTGQMGHSHRPHPGAGFGTSVSFGGEFVTLNDAEDLTTEAAQPIVFVPIVLLYQIGFTFDGNPIFLQVTGLMPVALLFPPSF